MKNLILLFVLSIFSFNFSFAQESPTPIPTVLVESKCVPNHNGYTYWKNQLMYDKSIQSPNTCIKQYELYGYTYYLVYGEGNDFDTRPLLIQQLSNGCFKEMGNIYPRSINHNNQGSLPYYNEYAYIKIGCVIEKILFFDKAKFMGYVYKKFPNGFMEW